MSHIVASSSPFKSQLSLMYGPQPTLAVKVAGEKKARQDKWDPDPSEEHKGLQQAHHCISIRDPLRTQLIEQKNITERQWTEGGETKVTRWSTTASLPVSREQFQTISDTVALVNYHQDLIRHHLTERVALFFQQAVVCYDTPFHFKIAHTEGQFFSSPTLKVSFEEKKLTGNRFHYVNQKHNAAHSSTLPGLVACHRSDYDRSLTGNVVLTYFPFLKGSHVEVLDNSTVGLPVCVNQIDTLIDGHSTSNTGLRADTIFLINEVAQAKLSPSQATLRFMEKLDSQLVSRSQSSRSMKPEKERVVQIYRERLAEMYHVANIAQTTDQSHPFFDSLLDVNVSGEASADIPIIRDIVYKRKYEIIREAQFTEARIQNIIDGYIPSTWSKDQKHWFRLALALNCDHVPNVTPLQRKLEKLFCISASAIHQDPGLYTDLSNYYRDNYNLFANIYRDIRTVIRNYQRMEHCFQAMLLKDLRRKMRNYSQEDLSRRIKDLVAEKIQAEEAKARPNAQVIRKWKSLPKSKSLVSRLENSSIHVQKAYKTPENQRRKELSADLADVIPEALGVQRAHFFCSFFASKE